MTQGGKKMEEIRKTSCIKRVISMLLAVLMILVSVPISSLTASAGNNPPRYGGDWGRPGWCSLPSKTQKSDTQNTKNRSDLSDLRKPERFFLCNIIF